MANIIGIHEIVNGPRNYVIKVDIEGDGAADESDFELVNVEYLGCGSVRLDKVEGLCKGFDVHLDWAGPTKVNFLNFPDGVDVVRDYRARGGLPNPKVANYTGNVSMVTSGLGASEKGTMTLHFVKKDFA